MLFGQDFTSMGEVHTFSFHKSERYSTYLYAICAGEYDFYERNSEGHVPMRIYARKSLLKDVNYEEMFNVT